MAMDTLRLLRWAAVTAFLSVLALPTARPALAADPFVSVGDELAVGKNRTGEACRLKLTVRPNRQRLSALQSLLRRLDAAERRRLELPRRQGLTGSTSS